MRIGGSKIHCEADEVAFRCRPIAMEDGEVKIEWMRYIAVLRRGSSKIYLEELPLRYTKGSGQGGGGTLSIDELDAVGTKRGSGENETREVHRTMLELLNQLDGFEGLGAVKMVCVCVCVRACVCVCV